MAQNLSVILFDGIGKSLERTTPQLWKKMADTLLIKERRQWMVLGEATVGVGGVSYHGCSGLVELAQLERRVKKASLSLEEVWLLNRRAACLGRIHPIHVRVDRFFFITIKRMAYLSWLRVSLLGANHGFGHRPTRCSWCIYIYCHLIDTYHLSWSC